MSLFPKKVGCSFKISSSYINSLTNRKALNNLHLPFEQFEALRSTINDLNQWFSNFLHQVPPQKIFGFPRTTIMTNIKMQ